MSSDEHTPEALDWTWQVSNYATHTDTGKMLSWVRCSVEGREGATVRLTSLDGAVSRSDRTGSHPEYGSFFCELGPVDAGWYTLRVEGLKAAVDLWLDGSAWAAVRFTPASGPVTLPPEPAEKTPHALLLGRMMAHQGNFLALTRYVACFGALVTLDPEEAAGAEHVILVGSPQLVSREIEQQLQQAGVRVERVEGDIAAQLDRAVEAGVPFLTT